MTLAILEILDNDVALADYLEKVVLAKLRLLAGLPRIKSKKNLSLMKNEGEIDENDLFAESSQRDI